MLFPYKDDNPRRFGAPIVVIGTIIACTLIFFYQVSLGEAGQAFVLAGGLIPFEISHFTDLVGWVPGPAGKAIEHPAALVPLPGTLFTSMFLHGGFMHLAGNMWFLWIFGDNIEDAMGRGRFVLFYLLCGLAAAALQIAMRPDSTVPMIGASGAIAGVLGGYARLYPRARVHTALWLGFLLQRLLLPAKYVLGFWILMQFLSAAGGGAGVAWYAHIGGFVAGLLLVKLFLRTGGSARSPTPAWN